MPGSFSEQARVGRRVAMSVLWTVILVVGVALGLLVGVPGLADLVQRASASTTEARTLVVAVAVAMILSGLWGIAASHRNLRHSVDLKPKLTELGQRPSPSSRRGTCSARDDLSPE